MIKLLVSLLKPILSPLGVSTADLTTYITNLIGYIYVVLGLLVLAIAIMVAAHFFIKKGTRHVVRWNAGLAWLLAVVVIVNLICYGPMYDSVSLVLNGSAAQLSEETAQQSKDTIKETGEEGIVLLKNNGLLPLSHDVKALNVFGWSSTSPIYGGTGSGSSDTESCISILQSLKDAGYQTNQSLTDMYITYQDGRAGAGLGVFSKDWSLPEPTVDAYTADLMREAGDFSDVAVICISRGGGEGSDEPTDMNAVIHGTWNNRDEFCVTPEKYNYLNSVYTNNGSYDDFEAGEHYLELSKTEEDMVGAVCDTFDKVIVVVNSNNVMELGWVDQYDSIGAVLSVPGSGALAWPLWAKSLTGRPPPGGQRTPSRMI